MSIKPMNGYVLVKYIESNDNIIGGIIIPETVDRTTQEAIIMNVGQGKLVNGKRDPIRFNIGDKVFINKHSKTEVCYDNEKHILIRAEDILAKTK